MTVLKEARHAGEFILNEASGHLSRENLTIAAEVVVRVGEILARVGKPAAIAVSAAAVAGNTGGGTITMATPAATSSAKAGTYRAVCSDASAPAKFRVEDPEGVEVGLAAVGTAFAKQVKFTIAASGAAFAVGDAFEVVVVAESPADFEYVPLNPAGTDGSQIAAAIAIYPVLFSEEPQQIAGFVRLCELNGKCLEWPAGITAAKQAAAITELAKDHVIIR